MAIERAFRISRGDALALFAAAPTAQLATTAPDGAPLLFTVAPVVSDGAVFFAVDDSARKSLAALASPAVLAVHEPLADEPTLFRRASIRGRLVAHEAHDGLLRVDGAVDGEASLLQDRAPDDRARTLAALWQRGRDGDPRAIELVRAANPDTPTPDFLRTTLPVTLHCALPPCDIDAAVALLAPEYWNDIHPRARIAGAIAGSHAFVGARVDGKLVACARALSDGHKYAWVYDVVVAPEWRGCGLGEAVMRVCLDHPRVRTVARVLLQTRDAQPLYRKLGFIEEAEAPPRPYRSTGMLRIQR
ncbi:MAG TPA: GNAT family N-acetyltransferase [Polyangia bacterium]|nr:GNAT family N-acetyltransferase [Polyangia bacterium]